MNERDGKLEKEGKNGKIEKKEPRGEEISSK